MSMGHDDLFDGGAAERHERLWPQPDRSDLDGAVVELAIADDGTIDISDVRIPGPAVP